jgi:hypothetical protein
MHRTISKGVLLAGALMTTMVAAAQQQQPSQKKLHVTSVDVAATFSIEHAQVAQEGGNTFWLKGGSAYGAVTFYRGFGLAANLTGEHSSNIQNNVGLSKIAIMAGPRYTSSGIAKLHQTQLFGEALFGGVHAFDSIFPLSTGTTDSAGAFSMQIGGGVNVPVAKGFGIRALEVDYIHTNLPNNASDSRNDLLLAFGATYHCGKH